MGPAFDAVLLLMALFWNLLSMLGPAVRGAARRVGKTSRVGKTETKGSGRERQELGAVAT